MDFIEYILKRESTGTVGAAASGQWADMPITGTEFYRKMGNQSRPKTVMWDDFSTPKNKSKLNPNKMFAMPRNNIPKSIQPVESFEEWLLNENTISQELKKIPEGVYRQIKIVLDPELSFYRIEPDRLEWFKKWLIYDIWTSINSKFPTLKNNPENLGSFQSLTYEIRNFARILLRHVRQYNDYIVHILSDTPDVARSKFNNLSYNIQQLEKDSEDWHEKLKLQTRKSADPGRRIDLPGMPEGYYWVSLDQGYCSKEANAMGHCGNQGGHEDDNIYSMRDAKGIPHLTFIVNNGKLGESKGYGNNKPEAKYHPQIVAFLLGTEDGEPIVDYIKGGGYLPQSNFHFTDLSKADQEKVTAAKPHLVSWSKYVVYKNGGKIENIKEYVQKELGEPIDAIEGQTVICKEFEQIEVMIKWLKKNTSSKLNSVPNFEDFNEIFDYYPDLRDTINCFDDANQENKELAKKIIEKIKQEHLKDQEESEYEDYDLEWAAKQNDDFESALRQAASDGYRAGAESEALDHVFNEFYNMEDEDENGFFTSPKDKTKKFQDWRITISLDDLGKIIEQDTGEVLTYYMTFEYRPPYNGYSGFDKDVYNEYLKEKLLEAFPEFEKDKE